MISSSGSLKLNTLLNLISWQPDNDKIYCSTTLLFQTDKSVNKLQLIIYSQNLKLHLLLVMV